MNKKELKILLKFLELQNYETKEEIINYLSASNNGSLMENE